MVPARAVIAIPQSTSAQIAAKRIRMIRFSMRPPNKFECKEFSRLSPAKPCSYSSKPVLASCFETELQIDGSLATHVIDSYRSSEVRTHPRVRFRPLRLFELARVFVRLNHIASLIVNADDGRTPTPATVFS
jgi:hypothetical protein